MSHFPSSPNADTARESARQDNGQFGTQPLAEGGDIDLPMADPAVYEHMSQEDRVALNRYFYRDAARNLDHYAADKANDFADVDRADAHYKHGMAIAAGEAYIVSSVPGAANITPPGAMGRTQLNELARLGDGIRPRPTWKDDAIRNTHEANTEAMTWDEAQQASNHMLMFAMLHMPPSLDARDNMSDPEFDDAWTKQGAFNAAVSHAIALREGVLDPRPDDAERLATAIRNSQAAAQAASPDTMTDAQQIADIWDQYGGVNDLDDYDLDD